MSKGLKNATQKTMRFIIDSIFKFNPERVYGIMECITLMQYEHYDFFESELFHLMKIVDIKIEEGIISSDDDGVIENIYYEYVVAIKEMICYLKLNKKDFEETYNVKVESDIERLKIVLGVFIRLGWDVK